ncbi:MAG: hypothetical protein IKS31_08655 [Clostridia bacterium]|nr:hypothetical protein [Clostridia bacterium]
MRTERRNRLAAWICAVVLIALALLLALDALLDLGLMRALGDWLARTDPWRRIILAVLGVGVVLLAVAQLPGRGRALRKPFAGNDRDPDPIAESERVISEVIRRVEAETEVGQLTEELDASKARVAELESVILERDESLAALRSAGVPEDPSEPEEPEEPEEPGEPEEPEKAEESLEPETPEEQEEPTEPEGTVEPEERELPEEPAETEGSPENAEPEEPEETEVPEYPDELSEPDEPDDEEQPKTWPGRFRHRSAARQRRRTRITLNRKKREK